MHKHKPSGFTLIEISLALVIIALLVGGILLGRDMIHAASLRSLISQMDSFKIATTSFKNKYGSLPGDMHPSQAAKFGMFTFTGLYAGRSGFGDNGGLINGLNVEWWCNQECGAFWRHLSDASLVGGNYGQTLNNYADILPFPWGGTPLGETWVTPYSFSLYMPAAKGGFGFIGAGSVNMTMMKQISNINKNQNLFWVVPAAKAALGSRAEPSLSAIDSYSIDSKIDDGKPSTGKFIVSVFSSIFSSSYYYWSNGYVDYNGSPLDSNSKVCTIGGADALATDVNYNTNSSTGGNNVTCIPLFLW